MIIELTDEQKEQLKPFALKAQKEAEGGKKGMVLAQVGKDYLRVGFLERDIASLFEKKATPVLG